jgi:hypothetical protein
MHGSMKPLGGYATAIAACVALGLAAQSCGVMSSSSDCAQRAMCSDDGGGSSSGSGSGASSSGGSGSGGPLAEAGDDGIGDESNEMMGDVVGDDTTADGAGEVGSDVVSLDVRDVTSEDARGDVVSEDVRDVVTEKPTSDVCVPTSATENCTNGMDDDCNGLVDCAETSCQTAGYTCVAALPTGWTGPALLWTGAASATAPPCPTGYQATDANAGPTGAVGTCNCNCTASGQVCSVAATFHADQTCSYTACASVTVSATATSTCMMVPANTCGTGGSLGGGATPAPSGGSCTPVVTPTRPAPSWTTAARICSWAAPPDTPGGCTGAGQQCVPGRPDAGSFGPTGCVYQSGDLACPVAYPNKTVLFAGETDSRSCGGCTCAAAPNGGSCGGSINVWGDSNGSCSGTASATYTLGSPCKGYSGVANNPGYVQANYTITPGTCSVTTQPTPTGAVTGTGPMTVCCK